MKITPATTHTQLQSIETLAAEIWREHYTPIIGTAQVAYMLDKFQSLPAMEQQISEGYQYFSLIDKNALIGYVGVQPQGDQLFLSKIYLHHSVRGKGFGREAIEFVAKLAKDMGLSSVNLTVNKYNEDTIKAYEKCGFVKGETVVFDIGAGYIMDDYRMEKRVSP